MKIDGKLLAEEILKDIKSQLKNLPKLTLAIVTLGPEDSWEKYVSQKIKLAKELGVTTRLINIKKPSEDKLIATIGQLNNDNNVTGIIVQRPLTRHIKGDKITYAVTPKKDIDGFIKNGSFKPPLWLAVKDILEKIFVLEARGGTKFSKSGRGARLHQRKIIQSPIEHEKIFVPTSALTNRLRRKNIAVLGKGETAGQPVIDGLRELGSNPHVIDSKTQNKKDILKNADIVISAVGKSNVFSADELRKGAIVIGIGLHREDGLKPDFNEEEISKVASFYTPTPGGVGPLNLAYLFKNLLKAATIV